MASRRASRCTTSAGATAVVGQAYAYFDRAWGNVLANLRKRFESGPIDWSDWMAQLRKMHQGPAR